jgi:hypothetical protein
MIDSYPRGRRERAMAYVRDNGDGDDGNRIDEDSIYDQFPPGASDRNGPEQGFNTWVRVNDRSLFTDEALENPAVLAFVEAPFAVTFAMFKSSHRESEYFIHKPSRAMSGQVTGILGSVDRVSDDPRTPISTLVLNHELSLAYHITRSVVISDDGEAGQIIHKEPGP